MLLAERYFTSAKNVLHTIEETQRDAIDKAAEAIVSSVLKGGTWNIYDTGHMLMHEAIGRAGGLMMVTPIHIDVSVRHPARPRSMPPNSNRVFMDEIRDLPRFVLSQAQLQAGDILLLGSVSGINVLPVEMAIQAKEMGLVTIGLTSVGYSKALEPQHDSGRRLCEVVDIVLDNCVPYGDALVEVEGLGAKICAVSGIAASYIIWAVQATVVEKLLARGVVPSVYLSNHIPGAGAYNATARKRYLELGY